MSREEPEDTGTIHVNLDQRPNAIDPNIAGFAPMFEESTHYWLSVDLFRDT